MDSTSRSPPSLRAADARQRPLWPLILLVVAFASSALLAQYQKKPPDFGGIYSFPSPTHPEPRGIVLLSLDVAMLAVGLGLGAYFVLKRRSRTATLLLSIAAIAYFGFYRKGCTCPIGSIQNVTLSLVDPRYMISPGVIAFFLLPLIAALLFGRVFCGGVCPLGTVQDLVLLRPKNVPRKLDRVLRWIPFVYLAVVIFFAGWGLPTVTSSGKEIVLRRFLICEWDPFIGIFRLSGPVPHARHRRRLPPGRHVLRPALLPVAVPLRRPPVHPVARVLEERDRHAGQGSLLRDVRRRVPVRRDPRLQRRPGDVRLVRAVLRVLSA